MHPTLISQTASAQALPTTLDALRDQARPLLIFGRLQDNEVEQQCAELARHANALQDRDVRVIVVTASTVLCKQYLLPAATLADGQEAMVRQKFHIAPDKFTVVLVGKDGGEKLRSSKPLAWQKLASTIDAMPMRQAEVKQR